MAIFFLQKIAQKNGKYEKKMTKLQKNPQKVEEIDKKLPRWEKVANVAKRCSKWFQAVYVIQGNHCQPYYELIAIQLLFWYNLLF